MKYESWFYFFCNFENSKIFIKIETENSECHLPGSPDTLTSDSFSPPPPAAPVTLCPGRGVTPGLARGAQETALRAPGWSLVSSSHAGQGAWGPAGVISPSTAASLLPFGSGVQPSLCRGPASLSCIWDLSCSTFILLRTWFLKTDSYYCTNSFLLPRRVILQ